LETSYPNVVLLSWENSNCSHQKSREIDALFAICSGRNGGKNHDANHEQLKSAGSMEVERPSVIKCLNLNRLKLDDLAMELSSLCRQNAHAEMSIQY
jgi:hypothetical protein